MNENKSSSHFSSKKHYRSNGRADPSYDISSNQGYFRDEVDPISESCFERINTHFDLRKAILEALKNDRELDSTQIQVIVPEKDTSTIELRGTVPVREMKLLAERAIQNVPHVLHIRNFIGIDVPPSFKQVGAFLSSEKTM